MLYRPMVPMTAPAILEGSPMTQGASMYKDPSFIAATLYPTAGRQPMLSPESSSDASSDNDCGSSLTGLSSPRDFSEAEDNPSGRKESKIPDLPNLLSAELPTEPLDLMGLNESAGSVGSLQRFEEPSHGAAGLPLTPRLSDGDTLNNKPVLPPIISQQLVV